MFREWEALRRFEETFFQFLEMELKWSRSSSALFRQADRFFFTATLDVNKQSTWKLEAKPMSLDPVYWSIMKMDENNDRPLSFRALGEGLPGLLIAKKEVQTAEYSEAQMARKFVAWFSNEASLYADRHESHPFSKLVESHEHYRARGAYAETLICSLFEEGRMREAIDLSKKFVTGEKESVSAYSSNGLSFLLEVLEWPHY